jgi:hypothetical protein
VFFLGGSGVPYIKSKFEATGLKTKDSLKRLIARCIKTHGEKMMWYLDNFRPSKSKILQIWHLWNFDHAFVFPAPKKQTWKAGYHERRA